MKSYSRKNIAVIGGGASGIIAAITAARNGSDVSVFEKNTRIGKKLLITGNGRCNYTNISVNRSNYNGTDPDFVKHSLSLFSEKNVICFFKDMGIYPKTEKEGRVYPRSLQAASMLDVLMWELNNLKIKVYCNSEVRSIKIKDELFIVSAIDNKTIKADKIILSAGGKTYPDISSNIAGYDIAEGFGHKISRLFPALVPLKLNSSLLKQISGVKSDAEVSIIQDEKVLDKATGEILFTEYGISGPAVLDISRTASELLIKGFKPIIKLNLIPEMNAISLKEYLKKTFKKLKNRTIQTSMVGFINKQLIVPVLRSAGIENTNRPLIDINERELNSLTDILQNWRFNISGTTSWPNAQVTAGGVRTDEINNKTMESKLVKGLYFAGEIMDIDGECGGYNLQWAWSSGYLAGYNSSL